MRVSGHGSVLEMQMKSRRLVMHSITVTRNSIINSGQSTSQSSPDCPHFLFPFQELLALCYMTVRSQGVLDTSDFQSIRRTGPMVQNICIVDVMQFHTSPYLLRDQILCYIRFEFSIFQMSLICFLTLCIVLISQ